VKMGDLKVMGYEIIIGKSLLGYTIAKEATKMGTSLELHPFMTSKRDKISTTKNSKR